MNKTGCISCGRELHSECISFNLADNTCCCEIENINSAFIKTESSDRGRPKKSLAEMTDVLSTFRKRAAVDYPIKNKKDFCEWRNLKNVGGGKYPIVGCITGQQRHIHHGPIKITPGFTDKDGKLFDFNIAGNVHRICPRCHTLWHHWNDTPYNPEEYVNYPHKPVPAPVEDLLKWASVKTRPKAPEPKKGSFKKEDD